MPATAGRVRMPANNRVHSSAALQTHGIWQSAIGYDPYAPNKDESKNSSQPQSSGNEPDADNPYNSYQGLLALARITSTNANEARGACKKCGRVGHLTFQCRNFLSVKDDNKEKDPEVIQAVVLSELNKIKGKVGKVNGKVKTGIGSESEDEDEEVSDSSDSDADSEIERIIAERYGKKVSNKRRLSQKKEMDDSDEDGSDSDLDAGKRKKRGKLKKRSGERRHSGSKDEAEGRRKRREKRTKRDESSDNESLRQHLRGKRMKEDRRRRSHRHSDDSDSDISEDSGRRHERKSQRSELSYNFDASDSDDLRVGNGIKRSKKKSQKRQYKVKE